ncbi:MAG: lipase family protein [Selenomonadaceae bacterium]|nr:lipase family protein [Selenomonadaceae bacterium]
MKKIVASLIIPLIICAAASASPLKETEFERREIELICALSSLAAYSGDESFLVRSNLTSRGWNIEPIKSKKNGVTVKAYTISKKFLDGRITKILVIAGTEDLKDVETDFKMGGVTLHEDTAENFLVHKGFRDYVDAALDEGVAEDLVTELKNNPQETLYLTGHSLGGSVAIVAAIRLSDLGVDKNQLKVITFGALAVGNKPLAQEYEGKINLTRMEVKGDVVQKIFAPFGYVQFGELVKWKPAKNVEQYKHKMAMYLDCALRNYFDADGFTFEEVVDENKIDVPIYIAPIKFVKKNFAAKDEKYIYGILRTGLTARHNKLIFAEKTHVEVKEADEISDDIQPLLIAAKENGCEYVLVQLINADRVRDTRENQRQVMLYSFLYDLNGMPIFMQTSGATTKDLTLIEAAALAQENLRLKFENFLTPN